MAEEQPQLGDPLFSAALAAPAAKFLPAHVLDASAQKRTVLAPKHQAPRARGSKSVWEALLGLCLTTGLEVLEERYSKPLPKYVPVPEGAAEEQAQRHVQEQAAALEDAPDQRGEVGTALKCVRCADSLFRGLYSY